jgi:mRNA-degrading endonuclease RelE of RelBE toxin-antitoxin system
MDRAGIFHRLPHLDDSRLAEIFARTEKGKPLSHDLAGLRSLRTSDYRIIYRVRGGVLVVLVVAVGHRREANKRLGELLGRAAKRK